MPLEGGLYEWSRLAFMIGLFSDGLERLAVQRHLLLLHWRVDGHICLLRSCPRMLWIAENKGIVVAASITLIAALLLLAHLGLSVGKWVINAGSAMTLFALVVLVCMPLFHILRGMHPDYHPCGW